MVDSHIDFMTQFYTSVAKVLGLEASSETVERNVTWPQFAEYLLKTSPENDVSEFGRQIMLFDSILPQNLHWKSYTDHCSPCLINFTYVVHLEQVAQQMRIKVSSIMSTCEKAEHLKNSLNSGWRGELVVEEN